MVKFLPFLAKKGAFHDTKLLRINYLCKFFEIKFIIFFKLFSFQPPGHVPDRLSVSSRSGLPVLVRVPGLDFPVLKGRPPFLSFPKV